MIHYHPLIYLSLNLSECCLFVLPIRMCYQSTCYSVRSVHFQLKISFKAYKAAKAEGLGEDNFGNNTMTLSNEKMKTLGYVGSMFTFDKEEKIPIMVPNNHIIHAMSLKEAHEILKSRSLRVLTEEEAYFLMGSLGTSLTPGMDFSHEFWKMTVAVNKAGVTTDWILVKEAKEKKLTKTFDKGCSGVGPTCPGKALNGHFQSNTLPLENNNYLDKNPCDNWKKERASIRKALKNSPAYIRGGALKKKRKNEDQVESIDGPKTEKNKKKKQKKMKKNQTLKAERRWLTSKL